jgi:hypothetical protein
MITRECKFCNKLVVNILSKISPVGKRRNDFFCEGMIPFLKGRIDFLLPGRYGSSGGQRYRQQFEKPFNFLVLM